MRKIRGMTHGIKTLIFVTALSGLYVNIHRYRNTYAFVSSGQISYKFLSLLFSILVYGHNGFREINFDLVNNTMTIGTY